MIRLQLLRDDTVLHTHPVGAQPVHVGRATTNELVLTDPKVSGRHLMVWVEGDHIAIEDLGSRNGTLLNGQPLTGRSTCQPGAALVLGGRIHLRLVGEIVADEVHPALLLEDLTSGVRIPLRTDRHPIGQATLLIHPDEVWLGTEDDTVELKVDTPFEVDGQRWVLRADTAELTRTEGMDRAAYPYQLTVSLTEASLTDSRTGSRHQITSEIRATLLYVLARHWLADTGPAEERGWMHDEDVASAIWGRTRFNQGQNNYHVLVHRVRADVKKGGLDPWFLEKKRKHLRIRVDGVSLT